MFDISSAQPGDWYYSRRTGHVWRYAMTRVDHAGMGASKSVWVSFWPSIDCSNNSRCWDLNPEREDLVKLDVPPAHLVGQDFDHDAWANPKGC